MNNTFPIIARYPIQNMSIKNLVEILHNNNIRFLDHDFPPDDESLIGPNKD
jgi:hypothetical protein